MNTQNQFDVAVIGAGLAGLTAAAYLAKSGRTVAVFERAPQAGGRAASTFDSECRFNLGPHALYRGGGSLEILAELGIRYHGAPPEGEGRFLGFETELHPLPTGPASLLISRALPLAAKVELGALLARLGSIDPTPWHSDPLRAWLDAEIKHSETRKIMAAFCRLATYGNNTAEQSAGATLQQLQVGGAGVYYIDGGWQTLVDELQLVAVEAGASFHDNCAVKRLDQVETGWKLSLADGAEISATAVISTVAPKILESMLEPDLRKRLGFQSSNLKPVQAACLDLALRSVPRPDRRFVLGVDQPLYFSIHSAWAKLGSSQTAVIHAAKYLDPHEPHDARNNEQELEAWMDLIQPGWRAETLHRRYMPQLTVTEASVMASGGGYAGRVASSVEGLSNLWVAGDWVGSHGMLADASLLSAQAAARAVLECQETRRVAPGRLAVA
ncbi:MAG TPA: FAD-dependent oxidoreductase [Candidatus Limnocylindria bacterium]|jgi:phytoene dehydrogenase-like protein|nr:FAD-dependent oxidoreductase [Candidatus Limnocylindria bacterium]